MPMEMTVYIGAEVSPSTLIEDLCAAGFSRDVDEAIGLGAVASADGTDKYDRAMLDRRLGLAPRSMIRFILQGEGPGDADRQILRLGARIMSARGGNGVISYGNGKVGLVMRDGEVTVDEALQGAATEVSLDLGRPVRSADLGTL